MRASPHNQPIAARQGVDPDSKRCPLGPRCLLCISFSPVFEDLVESDAPVAGERDKHEAFGGPLPLVKAESFLIMTSHAVVVNG